ncbi:MAG: hypothetical protein N3H30_01825 [Candidatus Micrarchaeota archaeon]|nr:hypothetical protein [Candidatus Micrarchaeota archaeon]
MSEFDFMDVALLKRIDVETTVEGFGPKISSTFFEAANLLGALKIKGYVDIHSAIGNSPVIVTEKGRALLRDLDLLAEEPLTRVDLAVLGNIKGGLRDPKQIESMLNVSAADIARSIYRLNKKGLVDYRLKNAAVELMLTAQGFEQEGAEVRQHAAMAGLKSPTVQVVAAPAEVRNTVAQELASQEISSGERAAIPGHERLIAKSTYYFTNYWYIVLLVGAAIIGIMLAAQFMK